MFSGKCDDLRLRAITDRFVLVVVVFSFGTSTISYVESTSYRGEDKLDKRMDITRPAVPTCRLIPSILFSCAGVNPMMSIGPCPINFNFSSMESTDASAKLHITALVAITPIVPSVRSPERLML